MTQLKQKPLPDHKEKDISAVYILLVAGKLMERAMAEIQSWCWGPTVSRTQAF